MMGSLPDVEKFTLEWEDTVAVTPHHSKSTDSQSLGRVSLCQDEGAGLRVLSTCVVGVIQLGYALDLRVLAGVTFLIQLTLKDSKEVGE